MVATFSSFFSIHKTNKQTNKKRYCFRYLVLEDQYTLGKEQKRFFSSSSSFLLFYFLLFLVLKSKELESCVLSPSTPFCSHGIRKSKCSRTLGILAKSCTQYLRTTRCTRVSFFFFFFFFNFLITP